MNNYVNAKGRESDEILLNAIKLENHKCVQLHAVLE